MSGCRWFVSCGVPSGFMTMHSTMTESPPRVGSGHTYTGLHALSAVTAAQPWPEAVPCAGRQTSWVPCCRGHGCCTR